MNRVPTYSHPVCTIISILPCDFVKTKKPTLICYYTYSPGFIWISVFFHYSNPRCYFTLWLVSHMSPVSSGLTGCHSFLAFDDLGGVLAGYPLECPSFWVCLVFLVIRLSLWVSEQIPQRKVLFSWKLPEITIVVQFFPP